MLKSWSRLSWAVKDGVSQKGKSPSFLGAEQDSVMFIAAMNAIALRLVDSTVAALDEAQVFAALPECARLLDIGGASGTYTEAFLRHLPRSSATVFDLPAGIAQARHRFIGSDMEGRVTLVEGDFTKTSFPGDFDFAWISAIIHQMDREDSRKLYRKTFAALKPGGMVAIRDFVMDAERTFPADGTLFGINMLVCTERGRVYSFEEIREDLEAAGFERVVHAVDRPTMSSVVTAVRP